MSMTVTCKNRSTMPRGLLGPHTGARPGERACCHGSVLQSVLLLKVVRVPVQCGLGGNQNWEPWRSNPWLLKRYWKMERHSLGSGTNLLDRGWTAANPGVDSEAEDRCVP